VRDVEASIPARLPKKWGRIKQEKAPRKLVVDCFSLLFFKLLFIFSLRHRSGVSFLPFILGVLENSID
jgi:hypothetical protein